MSDGNDDQAHTDLGVEDDAVSARIMAAKVLLDNLLLGLRQIGAAADARAAQSVLTLLEAEALRARTLLAMVIADLQPPPAEDLALDGSLQRLMVMAGPVTARDLVHRLLADLASVAAALRGAGAVADWDVVRAQAHILIALVGAAGARQVQTAAEELYQIALHADTAALQRALPPCLMMIATLQEKILKLPFPDDAPSGKTGPIR